MTYSVENWSTFLIGGPNLSIVQVRFAVVDLDSPVATTDGETEYEIVCTCFQEKHAVRLVHLLNREPHA